MGKKMTLTDKAQRLAKAQVSEMAHPHTAFMVGYLAGHRANRLTRAERAEQKKRVEELTSALRQCRDRLFALEGNATRGLTYNAIYAADEALDRAKGGALAPSAAWQPIKTQCEHKRRKYSITMEHWTCQDCGAKGEG